MLDSLMKILGIQRELNCIASHAQNCLRNVHDVGIGPFVVLARHLHGANANLIKAQRLAARKRAPRLPTVFLLIQYPASLLLLLTIRLLLSLGSCACA
jgi:hypothetical protein